ncbi:NAD(P)-dependent dehydrogenase (short-subunit alcohol dehydrogenase family) [Kitasatospora sp. MAA19]|nr:NAD(P)-dependent dehydrogenase (short-subunit alcohol dehydrogenase family) [Kitasatospora sp. MAA19]
MLADPANLERTIGQTALGLTALGRIGEVPDIADAVAFLAFDDARRITGTRIDVTGGVNL